MRIISASFLVATMLVGAPGVCFGQASLLTLSVAGGHACAITASHHVVCWGQNRAGQLGVATSEQPSPPIPSDPGDRISRIPVVVPSVRGAISIRAGLSYSCALLDSGKVVCWGGGSTSVREVNGLSGGIGLVRQTGSDRFCALLSTGYVCWEKDGGNRIERNTPVRTIGFATFDGPDPVAVPRVTGPCEVTGDSHARCWLSGSQSTTIDAPRKILQISPFFDGYCLLLDDGSVWCTLRLSHLPPAPRDPLGPVSGLTNIQALNCSFYFCLAIQDTGVTQLKVEAGSPTLPMPLTTKPIDGVFDAVEVSIGEDYVGCAKKSSGAISCWGNNRFGQLGRGSPASGDLPPGLVIGFP